jgi:hypothetical protein
VAAALGAASTARADDGNRTTPHRVLPALVSLRGERAAERYARARLGGVAFAVLGPDGRIRGVRVSEHFPSASVVKAMLLVAELRRVGSRPLSGSDRALLRPMIEVSDNEAAESIYGIVGAFGLYSVARLAGMRSFSVAFLFDAQLTAADQARFFLRIDKLVPRAHRTYARTLLSSIVPEQAWGIAPVARARHFRVFFKGGWRTGITHQAALLERDGQRASLAVLTRSPGMGYGEVTISGIASRVLAR